MCYKSLPQTISLQIHNFALQYLHWYILQITSQYFEYTWHHWCTDTQGILQGLQTLIAGPQGALVAADQDQALRLTCERWMLCLKVLRRMLLHGFQSDAKSVQVCHLESDCRGHSQVVRLLSSIFPGLERGVLVCEELYSERESLPVMMFGILRI